MVEAARGLSAVQRPGEAADRRGPLCNSPIGRDGWSAPWSTRADKSERLIREAQERFVKLTRGERAGPGDDDLSARELAAAHIRELERGRPRRSKPNP